MFFRNFSALFLFAVCGMAFSQQTTQQTNQQMQSPGLELNLDKFPQASTDENGKELQLDLEKFDQKDDTKELELNLEKFNDANKATQKEAEPARENGTVNNTVGNNKTAGNNTELNLDNFQQGNESATTGKSGNASVESTGLGKEKTGVEKINSTGSAAKKIDLGDADQSNDNQFLLRAGLGLLAVVIPLFMFLRWRSRKRRELRKRFPERYPERTKTRPYWEQENR